MTITPANRQKFEQMGYEQVRLDLLRGFEGNCKIEGRDNRDQALEWMGQQERSRWRMSSVLLWLTLGAAVIAALPVIKHAAARLIY